MSELTKFQPSRSIGILSEHFSIATILVLLVAVQGLFLAKHTVTLNAAAAHAVLGISAP